MSAETEIFYVLCIDDGGYPESLEVRKVYVALKDKRAQRQQYVRVIDETGEDYLYPATLFVPIEIPQEATQVMALVNPNSKPR